ncbi:SCP2 sterol-binding domain-containing protein [Vibrio methylphosphonaticus]|uniref:SCP2 sterol-binding domain-containing protein n=1 Tax=Vibrio methylphosphonaticus TaxID=2946866 RepID=UPI00202A2A37|nr:SCP2 sterol-binding domain-containing protein [Vibrio methylphosphonaticus]MCL9774207.1 SCP2 sterol-binding domain-containing protein [Vibrio methylphosphonaticus]
MFKRFALILSLTSSLTFACGLHQDTGFNLVTEPGSLEVFGNIISARQHDQLGNLNKPDHFRLFTAKAALKKPHNETMDFVLFEAIKGHYSDFRFTAGKGVVVTGRNNLPTEQDVLLITELDVFDALATGKISWDEAFRQGLVTINGPREKRQQLQSWLSHTFA